MSAYAPAPNAYRESAVLTATPEQLVVMLYDGANRFLTQSSVAMRDGRAGLAGGGGGGRGGGEAGAGGAGRPPPPPPPPPGWWGEEVAERLQALYLFFK